MLREIEQGYKIETFSDTITMIEDKNKCSMYLIEGKDKAILIDTGMTKGSLSPVLKTLTDLPIDLAITHAHIDHLYHANEFNNVYIFEDEQKNWKKKTSKTAFLGAIGYLIPIKKFSVKSYTPLKEGDTLPLAGTNIRVYRLQGHTPGSCIFIDEDNEVIFTGDAIGCGIGVWMWLLDTTSVEEYKQDLAKLQSILEPFKHFTFLSGHRSQGFENYDFKTPIPYGYQTILDMIELCNLVMRREVTATEKARAFIFNIYKYEHKTAAMWLKRKVT